MLEKSKAPLYFAVLAMMVVTLWAVAWVQAREAHCYHEALPPVIKLDPSLLHRDADDALTASAHP